MIEDTWGYTPMKKSSCCYQGLFTVAMSTGDCELAIQYAPRLLKTNPAILADDTMRCIAYRNFAGAYELKKDYLRSSEYYRRSAEVQGKIYGSDSVEVATTYYNTGNNYRDQGQYKEALKYYIRALVIQEEKLPENHFETAKTLGNIAYVHQKCKSYRKALEFSKRELEMTIKSRPEMHELIGISYQRFSLNCEATGQLELALENFVKAQNILRHSLPETHERLIQIQKHVDWIRRQLS
ncbi:unnamed protein product [Didymodactylos carnosus]|uniref:Tetratricopeptide repeat protein n=1 Tax=Didymodactylos carnosus TaxID=1234261 RepID=A0A815EX79_9BILA|nr:unnamed protein product [Didymodactylos carnosus]CAF1315974.1 unnamed protein product [Didymodactylos carnosus]CAF3574668.1 unnamed protein product [Didymodactylos carnosus]CAF4157970.1 unnamed protein product [Didymodactylos carnosus]